MNDGQLLPQPRTRAAGAFAPALLAGFAASVAMLLAFAIGFGAALVLGRLPVPVFADWFRGLTNNSLIDAARPNLYAATAVFFLGGLFWALLYGLVFAPRVNGPGWRRGALFALIPWLFSLVIFLPLLGGGLLGLSLGAGPLPTVGNLIVHVVYGVILGAVFGAAEPSDHDDLLAAQGSERGAARGLLVGLALGVVVGALGAALIPQVSSAPAAALNPFAMLLALGLIGAAFGGFVGSLLGA